MSVQDCIFNSSSYLFGLNSFLGFVLSIKWPILIFIIRTSLFGLNPFLDLLLLIINEIARFSFNNKERLSEIYLFISNLNVKRVF
jgi:hypothetical protein